MGTWCGSSRWNDTVAHRQIERRSMLRAGAIEKVSWQIGLAVELWEVSQRGRAVQDENHDTGLPATLPKERENGDA